MRIELNLHRQFFNLTRFRADFLIQNVSFLSLAYKWTSLFIVCGGLQKLKV